MWDVELSACCGDLEFHIGVFDVGGLDMRHNESTSAEALLEGR
jgi:hypothetical protein